MSGPVDPNFNWHDLELTMLDFGYPSIIFQSLRQSWPGDEVVNALLYYGRDTLERDVLMQQQIEALKTETSSKHDADTAKLENEALTVKLAEIVQDTDRLRSENELLVAEKIRITELERELEELRQDLEIERTANSLCESEKARMAVDFGKSEDVYKAKIDQLQADFNRMEDGYKKQLLDLQGRLAESRRREGQIVEKQQKDRKNFQGWKKLKYEPCKAELDKLKHQLVLLERNHRLVVEEQAQRDLRDRLKENREIQTEPFDEDDLQRRTDQQDSTLSKSEIDSLKNQLKSWAGMVRPMQTQIEKFKEKQTTLSLNLDKLEKAVVEHLGVIGDHFHVQVERSFLNTFIRSIQDYKEELLLEGDGSFSSLFSTSLASSSAMLDSSLMDSDKLSLSRSNSIDSSSSAEDAADKLQSKVYVNQNSTDYFDPRLPKQPSILLIAESGHRYHHPNRAILSKVHQSHRKKWQPSSPDARPRKRASEEISSRQERGKQTKNESKSARDDFHDARRDHRASSLKPNRSSTKP